MSVGDRGIQIKPGGSGWTEGVPRRHGGWTILLLPGGVSQAAACDRNWYSFSYNHTTLSLAQFP